jgi:hypothetical protein
MKQQQVQVQGWEGLALEGALRVLLARVWARSLEEAFYLPVQRMTQNLLRMWAMVVQWPPALAQRKQAT